MLACVCLCVLEGYRLGLECAANNDLKGIWSKRGGEGRCVEIGHSQTLLAGRQTGQALLEGILFIFTSPLKNLQASLMAQMVQNPPAMQETHIWSLGWEDLLEKGLANHCSILAWRISWTEELVRKMCNVDNNGRDIILPSLFNTYQFSSVHFSPSVMSDSLWNHGGNTPGLPVHYQLPEFTQTHFHWIGDASQPSHPLLSPSPPVFNFPSIRVF